jgi:hypothetical protein
LRAAFTAIDHAQKQLYAFLYSAFPINRGEEKLPATNGGETTTALLMKRNNPRVAAMGIKWQKRLLGLLDSRPNVGNVR